MIPFISNLFNLSVTKKEVLKRARIKKYQTYGLCAAIAAALDDYNVHTVRPQEIFEKFTNENARQFGAIKSLTYGFYWWEEGNWTTGRMDFLNWLIKEYKDDKTNLRKL